MLLFMSLPRLSSFSSRFVFGFQPAQLLPRLEILSLQHEDDWVAFNLDTHHNGVMAVNYIFHLFGSECESIVLFFFYFFIFENPCEIQVWTLGCISV